YTLYTRHMEIRKRIETWGDNKGTTAVVDHGANPGLVSHFMGRGSFHSRQYFLNRRRRRIQKAKGVRRQAGVDSGLFSP
ncbi:hypothetical protein EPO44_05635, partial [bacterium]